MTTREHYERLLAPIYGWMLGDRATALDRSREELRSLGVGAAGPDGRALDLGAGLGLQSIPLAELGYDVTAVDTSLELLAELERACPEVEVLHGDITELASGRAGEYDVVVCMGDTLTHLPSEAAVDKLLGSASRRLRSGGRLVLTFRDYSGQAPAPENRFILVRADDTRLLTCHLEYESTRVHVTDLVHERRGDRWTLRASTYQKRRLAPAWVRDRLETSGFVVDRFEQASGRVAIAARAGGAGAE